LIDLLIVTEILKTLLLLVLL